MKYFDKIASFTQGLDHKQLQQYMIAFLVAVIGMVGIVMYFFHQKNTTLITEIKKLEKLSKDATQIITNNKKMTAEESRVKKILERKKGFSIKGFFETFAQTQNITPEAGWDTQTRDITGKFGEIILPATFRGYTTEKLVEVLVELDKEEIVYIKELTIRSVEDKKIDFDISIATKQYKNTFE